MGEYDASTRLSRLARMCGFEVRILPKSRNQNDEFPVKDSVWSLVDNTTKERTAHAFLQVTEEDIQKFNNRIRQISTSGVVTTLAGSGQYGSLNGIGGNARFANPSSVAVDNAGNIYVLDTSFDASKTAQVMFGRPKIETPRC